MLRKEQISLPSKLNISKTIWWISIIFFLFFLFLPELTIYPSFEAIQPLKNFGWNPPTLGSGRWAITLIQHKIMCYHFSSSLFMYILIRIYKKFTNIRNFFFLKICNFFGKKYRKRPRGMGMCVCRRVRVCMSSIICETI